MNTKYCSALWRAFLTISWFTAIPFVISICCFYFGLSYSNACPLSPIIPRSFVAFGVFISILNIVALILITENFITYPGDHEATGIALVMIGYIFVFTISALILSLFIMLRPGLNYPENDFDCHPSIYTFANIFVIFTFGLVLLLIILLCSRRCLRRRNKRN